VNLRPYGNTPPAKSRQSGSSPLLCGFDGIYLGYYGEVPGDVYNVLSERGEIAIQGMSFKVQWKRRGPYSVVLDSDSLNVALGNTAPTHYSPSVYVQVKSEFLWSAGMDEAHRQVLEAVNDLYNNAPHREQISRADMFADIDWPKPFYPGDIEKFRTRAKSKATFYDGQSVSGFVIGKGKIMARIYNKTLELRRSGKEWLYELWGVDKEAPVWRVEFQLRREALKEFGIETFDDLLNASQSLWQYCTSKWLSVRGKGPPARFWESVQAARFTPDSASLLLIKRERMRSGMTEKQAADQIGGIVESYARGEEIDLYSKAFNQLIPRVRERWIRCRESTSQN